MLGIDAGTAEMRSKAGLELGKIVELRRVDLVGDITNDSVSSQRLSHRCPTTLFQILSRSVQPQAVTGQFARQQWPLARPGEHIGNVGPPPCGLEESPARGQELARATCREGVCRCVSLSVVAGTNTTK